MIKAIQYHQRIDAYYPRFATFYGKIKGGLLKNEGSGSWYDKILQKSNYQ